MSSPDARTCSSLWPPAPPPARLPLSPCSLLLRRLRLALLAACCLATLGLALTATPARASSPPYAHVGGSCPNASPDFHYYAGTRAYATCRWSAGTGDTLARVECLVNGLKLFEVTWDPTKHATVFPPMYNPDLFVAFSTTQFGPGTPLHLKARLWTQGGAYAEAVDESHVTHNQAYSIWHDYMPWTSALRSQYADNFFAFANHAHLRTMTSKSQMLTSFIPAGTAWHATVHGTATGFSDSFSVLIGGPGWITLAELVGAIASKGPSDCQYNFVFMDACHSAVDYRLFEAWNTLAYLGWVTDMWDDTQWGQFVCIVYEALGDQKTVDEALARAAGARIQWPTGRQSMAGRYGDGTYRVHKVYEALP